MSEKITIFPEFDQIEYREIEKKFLPVFPVRLESLLADAEPVAQYYLSHPSEEFSLRVREVTHQDGTTEYTATIKDKGELTDAGLERLEVEIDIDKALYDYYRQGMPAVYKHRATPYPGVAVDFYAHDYVQCEAENVLDWKKFVEEYGDEFVDVSSELSANNEWRAHLNYRKRHEGQEALIPPSPLEAETITAEILDHLEQQSQSVIRITGRSGSGKSTLLREVEAQLAARGVGSITLSTDDYHRGKTWLDTYKGSEWTAWDAPIVYDVDELIRDLEALTRGEHIIKRSFDFAVQEPAFGETLYPQPVILVEGIYARSQQLDQMSDLSYDVPTPFATCIGRRLMRDLKERPQFADPEKSLSYMLEQAEPAYRKLVDRKEEQ